MFAPTQCSKKITGCFCDSIYVKNAVYTDLIQPKTAGGTVSIPSLVIPPPVIDCLTLSASQTSVGCGADGSGGQNNTAVGINTLSFATGNGNTAIGYASGNLITNGLNNTLLGYASGSNITTGENNTLIGKFASGILLTTGSNNTVIGSDTAFELSTGEDNTIIGYRAGYQMLGTLNGCVLIGALVGTNNLTPNRLMIDNSTTNEPLIDGDFAGDTLQINGTTTLGTNATTPIHTLNTAEAPTASEDPDGYLRIRINNRICRIKLFEDTDAP